MKKVLIPGSFDPVTIGHYDVIERCAKMFDEVYVVTFKNTEKSGKEMFGGKESYEMLKITVKDLPNVHADITDKLVVDYAKGKGIDFIVKGVRDTTDFEYEHDLYCINKEIGGIDTLFLPSASEYKHISSTFVRDMIKYGRDITPYVPKGVADYIKSIE